MLQTRFFGTDAQSWINATTEAAKHGKRVDVWLKTKETQEYIDALCEMSHTTFWWYLKTSKAMASVLGRIVMASLAEMERELIVERTRAGLDVARQLGRKGGRKPKMTDSKIESAKKLLASGVPPKDVAKNLGVSVPTLYRWIPASTTA